MALSFSGLVRTPFCVQRWWRLRYVVHSITFFLARTLLPFLRVRFLVSFVYLQLAKTSICTTALWGTPHHACSHGTRQPCTHRPINTSKHIHDCVSKETTLGCLARRGDADGQIAMIGVGHVGRPVRSLRCPSSALAQQHKSDQPPRSPQLASLCCLPITTAPRRDAKILLTCTQMNTRYDSGSRTTWNVEPFVDLTCSQKIDFDVQLTL